MATCGARFLTLTLLRAVVIRSDSLRKNPWLLKLTRIGEYVTKCDVEIIRLLLPSAPAYIPGHKV